MLCTLRRSSLAPTLRRFIAVLLVLCVSAALGEQLIADPCADAAAQQAAGAGVVEGSLQAFVVHIDSESGTDRSQIPDGHTLHLCHCAHAHGSTLSTRDIPIDRIEAIAVAVASDSDRIPPSVVGEPQLRPPRVLAA